MEELREKELKRQRVCVCNDEECSDASVLFDDDDDDELGDRDKPNRETCLHVATSTAGASAARMRPVRSLRYKHR